MTSLGLQARHVRKPILRPVGPMHVRCRRPSRRSPPIGELRQPRPHGSHVVDDTPVALERRGGCALQTFAGDGERHTPRCRNRDRDTVAAGRGVLPARAERVGDQAVQPFAWQLINEPLGQLRRRGYRERPATLSGTCEDDAYRSMTNATRSWQVLSPRSSVVSRLRCMPCSPARIRSRHR